MSSSIGPSADNPFRGEMDRRTLLRWFGGGAAVVAGSSLLIACGSDAASEGGTATTVKTASSGEIFTEPTKDGGTMTMSISQAQSEGADPLLTFGQVSFYLSSLVFDRLVIVDTTTGSSSVAPRLAESWEISPDASTYTIKLRPGVKFHDGSPLTAADVVFNLKRFISEESMMKGNLMDYYEESGVTQIDELTTQIQLIKPNAMLMNVFREWNCSIYPDGTTDFEKCIGTGPFKLDSFDGNQGASATKNDDYWQEGKPYLDEVRITIIPEAESAIQALSKGQIDAIAPNTLDQASVQTASKLDGVEVLRLDNYWFDNIQINPYIEPFTDVRLRKAAAMAIDPQLVADQLYQGDAVIAANIPVPPSSPFFPESLKSFKADPVAAKALIAEAGYPDGVDLKILVSDDRRSNPVMQLFANQLEAAGIRVELDTKPAATFTDEGNGWGTGPAWQDGWWVKYPVTMALYLLSDTEFYRTWGTPESDAAIAEAFVTPDEAKQIEILAPVFEQASAEAGLLIPIIRDGFVPVSGKLRGLDSNTFNLDGYFEQIGIA